MVSLPLTLAGAAALFAIGFIVTPMRPVDLSPVRDDEQTQRPFDLFLIFVGASMVSTTLQVGASLPVTFTPRVALIVIALGGIGGAALVASLTPIGTRLRVPSIVAARAALGFSGAQALALLLFVTNFAWIALNNVIAASICAKLAGGGNQGLWATALGVVATVIVLGGPRAVALMDRVAVPLLFVAGVVFTAACLRAPSPSWPIGPAPAGDTLRGLDVVAGYQVTWLLMFADYPRFVRSGRGAGLAVFIGLSLTALWFMPLGLVASALARSPDPGTMVFALGIGWWGAVLLALATLTTNFVNIYMSALAFKSLRPAIGDRTAIWLIGGIGAALGLLSNAWIEQFAGLTLLLAGVFVPIGGILLAHYFVLARTVRVPDLYNARGPLAARHGWSVPGTIAWILGALVFYLAQGFGGSLPSLIVSIVVYVALANRAARK
jgi:purine-cytosine permease-like protein